MLVVRRVMREERAGMDRGSWKVSRAEKKSMKRYGFWRVGTKTKMNKGVGR